MTDNRSHEDSLPDGGTSGPFAQGGRFFLEVTTKGFEDTWVTLLYDFADAQSAVGFIRHRLIPAALMDDADAPGSEDHGARAFAYFIVAHERREAFKAMVELCDHVIAEEVELDEDVIAGIRGLFRAAFWRSQGDDDAWEPALPYSIDSYGTLVEVLLQQGLVDDLYDYHAEGHAEDYEHEILAALVINEALDPGDPDHVEMVRAYWEALHVLAR